MLSERLTKRVFSASNPKHYALRKHRLRFHKKSIDCSGKCSIVKTESDKDIVHGVLYDVADDEIDALDSAEGVGYGYMRSELTLQINGALTKVCTYIAEQKYITESLVPYKWYYDLVLAGAEQHALPSDYVAGLQAVPFTHDPKPDRKSRLEALEVLKKYEDSKKKC